MIILTIPTRSSSSSTSNQPSTPPFFPSPHTPPTSIHSHHQKNSTTAIHLSTPQNIQSSPPRNRLSRRFQILLCNFNISKHRDFFERQNLCLEDEFVTEIGEYYNGDVDVGGYEGFGTPAAFGQKSFMGGGGFFSFFFFFFTRRYA